MIKIKIKNPIIACRAGEWCNNQLGENGWELDVVGMFSSNPEYNFRIPNEKDAVLFGLTWAEYA